MQEVPQEPDAIENGNLGAIRFLVERRGVLGHKWVDHIRGDKQVVVNLVRRPSYLGNCRVDVVLSDTLHLHFVGGDNRILAHQTDFHVAQ